MQRLIILICQLNKSVTPTKYFFKVPLVGRLVPLVGVIGRSVESPLNTQNPHLFKVNCLLFNFGISQQALSFYIALA